MYFLFYIYLKSQLLCVFFFAPQSFQITISAIFLLPRKALSKCVIGVNKSWGRVWGKFQNLPAAFGSASVHPAGHLNVQLGFYPERAAVGMLITMSTKQQKYLQLLISRLTKLRWIMLLFPNATHQPVSEVILHNISILNRVKYLWTKVKTTFLILITKLNLTLCRQTVAVSGYMARGRWSVLCGNIPAPECLCGFASSATLLWAF